MAKRSSPTEIVDGKETPSFGGNVKELAFKDEQLKGKRALWMDSHPGSSARRDAMSTIRNPFTSPTASHKSRFDSNPMGIMTSPPQNSSSANSTFGAPSASHPQTLSGPADKSTGLQAPPRPLRV
jgi:hypothetical protein